VATVFISYSRKDIEFAKRLTGELQKHKLDFWIDWEGIAPTVDWWKEIEKGIEGADIFLFLISPDSVRSKVCGQEIDHAILNGKRLIPLLVHETPGDEIPPQLGHLNWISFSKDGDFDAALEKLLTAIHTDYEWVATHRRLQVKALEWERNGRERGFLLRGKDLLDAETNLARNASKEPHPTELQHEYVLQSRKATDRQRRITTGVSIAGVIALAVLAVWGWGQAALATSNEQKAVDNAETAQAVSTIAVSNASTAQAASTLAVSNEQQAIRQAEIALARQLAVQAQPLFDGSKQRTSVLLAILSMRLFPTLEAAQILQNDTQAKPLAHITLGDWVYAIALSPDGKTVVAGGGDNTARIWELLTGKEIARLSHDDIVYTVAYSHNGQYVATGSDDHTVRVWEALTGREVARFTHDDKVNSVAFSPDDRYVASASFDDTARVWEVSTGDEVARMTHADYVNVVAFSPEGNEVVSGSADNTARVWEALTGTEIARKMHFVSTVPVIGGGGGGRGGGGGVSAVAFSPDGTYVVSGGCDERDNVSQCVKGTAFVWDSSTAQVIASMTHTAQVSAVAFSSDGRTLVSGDSGGSIIVWETVTGRELARMQHDGGVSSLAISPDTPSGDGGKYIISGSGDGTARVWEGDTGQEIARMTHDNSVSSVALSPDGRYAVSGGLDGSIHVWEPISGTVVSRMTFGYGWTFSPAGRYMMAKVCDERDVNDFCAKVSVYVWERSSGKETAHIAFDSGLASAAFSPDEKYLVVGSDDNSIHVLDLTTGQEIARMSHEGAINSVAFSPDSKWVVSTSWDSTARVWDASTGQEVSRMTHADGVKSAVFSPDTPAGTGGRYVVSGGGDSVRVWEAATGKEISMIPETNVYVVRFSPDGQYVLTTGLNSTARVWEADTGKEVAHMEHTGSVISAAFSPDGKYIASAGGRTAKVWEVTTGKEIASMPHDGFVNSVAFSPDSIYVVSGSMDKTARVWEAATGKEIARMTHNDQVGFVSFSPDGKYVLSESSDNTLLWVYRPQDLVSQACSHMTRNLTRSEWSQYIGTAMDYQGVCENLPLEPETIP